MRIVLSALIFASAAVACAFALFSPQTRIAVPEAVFKGSVRRLMADLLKKLDTMKPVDAGAVDRYRGIPPFRETRGYIARVMGYMRQYRKERV